MKLIPFQPGELFDRLKKHVENIFGFAVPDPAARTSASITETDKEVIVRWQLPGCQDVQVYVDKQTLTLNCAMQHEEDRGDRRISYAGQFRQRLLLPSRVKGEKAITTYEQGVIEVRVEKE